MTIFTVLKYNPFLWLYFRRFPLWDIGSDFTSRISRFPLITNSGSIYFNPYLSENLLICLIWDYFECCKLYINHIQFLSFLHQLCCDHFLVIDILRQSICSFHDLFLHSSFDFILRLFNITFFILILLVYLRLRIV